ncbi:glycoside hydrolase family 15 protein [Timonella senegalensis]|uniref:glycoside hydrolase family 15 protein n=1 Tax=Timonella senegalensis TaxID=1465825 RepID=UPI0002EDA244|nr:glycoside hydrolase family 15 protein [Timonella senegalensis]
MSSTFHVRDHLRARGLTDERLEFLIQHSAEVIRGFQEPNGAYPASPTFSAYKGYSWLRDGSFIAEGMSRFGDVDSVNGFHDWVNTTLSARREQVDALVVRHQAGEDIPLADMLPTRFTFDGADGSDPWWDFQTDGYGMWLWQVGEHASRHRVDPAQWEAGMAVAFDFAAEFWNMNCYDWWEEHSEAVHTSTLGALFAGFTAVSRGNLLDDERTSRAVGLATQVREFILAKAVISGRAKDASAQHLSKWIGADTVDASLAACVVPFGVLGVDSVLAANTINAVERDLSVYGGVHRFRADVFFGGGQWLLLSCLVAWNKAASGDLESAADYLVWVASQALENGDMPEQVNTHMNYPEHEEEWIQKWGPAATPLLWSHGMFLTLADSLGLLETKA